MTWLVDGAFGSSVRQHLRINTVLHGGAEGAALLQHREKVFDLQAVGRGIALQEKGFRVVLLGALGIGLGHFTGAVVAALQHAGGANDFKALVVTVSGTACGVDLAESTLDGLDGDCRAVKVPGLPNGRVGQAGASGAEPGGFVAIAAQESSETHQSHGSACPERCRRTAGCTPPVARQDRDW